MAEQDVVLSDLLISKLAREVARNLVPITRLKETYGLDQEQFEAIVATPFFQRRFAEEQATWSASDANSIVSRIGAKSATMVEECLPELYTMIHDRLQPLAAKVEAIKTVARWAGVGDNQNVRGNSEDKGVRITINIGDQQVTFDKERSFTVDGKTLEGEAVELTPDVTR